MIHNIAAAASCRASSSLCCSSVIAPRRRRIFIPGVIDWLVRFRVEGNQPQEARQAASGSIPERPGARLFCPIPFEWNLSGH